ncbi:hypothetical protein FKP32DRAFT_874895 [Trametes sanguinea]|nr:hypothetical protein FKP32DRAFT_874895 [Trametes sanguinea]
MAGQPRYPNHHTEYGSVVSALRAAEVTALRAKETVSEIAHHSQDSFGYTLRLAVEDIQTVSSCQQTCREICALSATRDRLSGTDSNILLQVKVTRRVLDADRILDALYAIKTHCQEKEFEETKARQSQNERPREGSEGTEESGELVRRILGPPGRPGLRRLGQALALTIAPLTATPGHALRHQFTPELTAMRNSRHLNRMSQH